MMLVDNTQGQANSTTANGAHIPTAFLNALGNILEACVNSTGGGTNAITGLPTTTTTASGTSNDGTICGRLFAYTSYTADGTATGTLTAAGNTLDAIKNLARRPSGSPTLFDTACSSNVTGTTPAATCIYNLSTPNPYYTTALTDAPPDWMLGIFYVKYSFGAATSSTYCGGSTMAPSTVYPLWLATDIDDNIAILNSDSSNTYCYNVITIANDGTPIGTSTINNEGNTTGTTKLGLKWLSTDAYGHAIVAAGSANVVDIYAAGPSDSTISLARSVAVTGTPTYSGVENNGDTYTGGVGSSNSLQVMTAGTLSHTVPTYTVSTVGTATTKNFFQTSIDIYGNVWTNNTLSASVVSVFVPGASANKLAPAPANGCTSSGAGNIPDSNGNEWLVADASGCGSTPIPTHYLPQ